MSSFFKLFVIFFMMLLCVGAHHHVNADQAYAPFVKGNSSGSLVCVFLEVDDNQNLNIQATTYSPTSGVWTTPVNISETGEQIVSAPLIVMDSTGDAVVIWSGYDNVNNTGVIRAVIYTGGVWGSPTTISSTDFYAYTTSSEQLVLASGNISVIYTAYNSTNSEVQETTGTITGGWNTPITISD